MTDHQTSFDQADLEQSVARWQQRAARLAGPADPEQTCRPEPAPSETRPLGDGFALQEALGHGGMGEVFRARQQALHRDVAYKKLRGDLRDQPAAREAFVAEAVVTGRLEHPHIIPIYALGEQAGELFMAMKLAGGRTWRQVLSEQPATQLDAQLEILLKVCDAVAFAHSQHVSHNDLKPANIMLGNFGEVVVLDWGLALDFSDPPPPDAQIRHCSSVCEPCGTPSYMAPELALGLGDCIGPWTDIYLLGGILYRLLCGQPPHGRGSLEETVRRASQADVEALPGDLPERLRWICEKALSRLPRNRHRSVADFRAELAAYRDHRAGYQLAEQARAQLQASRGQARTPPADATQRYQLYEGFATAAAGFRQAREIWPENPGAVEGERQARQTCAETALRLGDLGMASVQATALDEAGGEADVLHRAIAQRRRAQARLRSRALWLRRGMLAALLGIMLLLALWKRQRDQDVARLQAEKAQLEAARAQVLAQKISAERNASLALDAFTSLISGVRTQLLDEVSTPRAHQLSQELLQTAADGLARIRAESSLRDVAFARALAGLGELKLDLDDDPEGALADFQAAERSLARRLGAGTLREAELEVYCGLLDLLGEAELARNRLEAARELLERGLRLREGLPVRLPAQMAHNLYLLSRVALEQGELDTARGLQRRGLELCRTWLAADSSETALRQRTLFCMAAGETLEQQGQDGREAYDEALRLAGLLMARNPNSRTHQLLRAEALLRAGDLALLSGALRAADAHYGQALALAQQLAQLDPGHADTRKLLAFSLRRVAHRHAQAAAWAEARASLEQALTWLDAQNQVQRPELLRVWADLGEACHRQGDPEAAARHFEAALQLAATLPWGEARLQLARKAAIWRVSQRDIDGALALFEQCWQGCRLLESPRPWLHGLMLAMQVSRAGLLSKLGRGEEARLCLEETRSYGLEAMQRQPTARTLLHNLARCLEDLGVLHFEAGRVAEARAAFAQGGAVAAKLAELSERAPHLRQYSVNLEWLATSAQEDGDLPAAQQALQTCVALRRALFGRDPSQDSGSELCLALHMLLAVHQQLGELAEARQLALEAIELAYQLRSGQDGPAEREQLGLALIDLAQLDEALGDGAAALQLVEECLRARLLPNMEQALQAERKRLRAGLGGD